MIKHIYPVEVENFISSNDRKYIPRQLTPEEHLRIYKRYWCTFTQAYFKVYEVFNEHGQEYYSVKYLNSLYGTKTYPLNSECTYELMIDKNNISNIDNIINNKISYSGAEIKYWFFSHNIDFNNPKYSGFWGFINPCSQSVVKDNKFYFLYASVTKNGNYKDCKVSLDRRNDRR